MSPFFLGTQTRPSLRSDSDIKRQLRLMVAGHRNARGVNLREARVGEIRSAAIGPPDGGAVRGLGVGRKVKDVAVAAGGQHHRVARIRADRAGPQVAGDDAAGLAVDHHEVEHFGVRVHRHGAGGDLTLERLVGPQQQLLAGLAAGVKRALDLHSAERPGREQPAVFAGKRHSLGDALVDDVDADLRQPVGVALAGAEVAPFDRVVKEADRRCRRRCGSSWRR